MRVSALSVAVTCLLGVVAITVAACLGADPGSEETPASGVPAGELGGACYPNGTCIATLECRDGRCVAASPSSDGGGAQGDGAGEDASGSDASSCRAAIRQPDAGPTCPLSGNTSASCAAGSECCALFNDVACQSPCVVDPQDTVWTCTAPTHCSTGSCCLDVDAVATNDATRCPAGRVTSAARSECVSGACPSPRVTLCLQNSDCNGGQCVPTNVAMGSATVVLGLCF